MAKFIKKNLNTLYQAQVGFDGEKSPKYKPLVNAKNWAKRKAESTGKFVTIKKTSIVGEYK